MKREYMIQGTLTAVGAYLSSRLGILFPVLCLLLGMMVLDYVSGMLASKKEALDHPGDTSYGWSSKKGAKGIIKKLGYMCAIAVAMVVDYVIMMMAEKFGWQVPIKVFFGLAVTVWYLLNELLSIIENVGRMGADVPIWLQNYIAVLRDKIDTDHTVSDGK